MNHMDYQARMIAAYHDSVPRLMEENRKLKQIIVLLLLAGTAQWLAFGFL